MLTIIKTTILELYKKRLIRIINIGILIYLLIFAFFVSKFMENTNSLSNFGQYINTTGIILLFGFYFSSMLIAFLTIMSSIGIITPEIENNTISTVLTRPLSRKTYIAGKMLGINILIWFYSTFIFVCLLLIGFIFKVPAITNIELSITLKSWLFYLLQPTAIISFSIFGSSIFKTMSNGILIVCVYILGLIGSFIEQFGNITENNLMVSLGILSSLISPFETIYRIMFSSISKNLIVGSLLAGPFTSSVSPSNWMILYFFMYIIILPLIGMKVFNKKDL